METTKLSSKGQVVLPKTVRDEHGWNAGTEFIVESTPKGVFLRPKSPFKPTRIEDVYGCLPYKGKAKTIAEMDQSIAKEVTRRRASGRY